METLVRFVKPDLNGLELSYVVDAIRHSQLTYRAAPHQRFEDALSKYLGKPALACASGTASLHLALLAAGIGAGREVIVPDLTFGSAASVVLACGARPVLVDIDPETFGLDPQAVRRAINRRTSAIMPTHLYGMECELPDLGILTIEDSCEAFGIVPPTADYTCYSFFVNKPITTGEGGAVTGRKMDTLKKWRDGSFSSEYAFELPGLNYRMTALQAALGCAQLERADELIEKRLANSRRYAAELPGKGKWLFCVETPFPRGLQKHLESKGIESRMTFMPLHIHPPFRQEGKFLGAMKVWQNYLSLPTGPHVTPQQQDLVIEAIDGYHNLCRTSDRSRRELGASL